MAKFRNAKTLQKVAAVHASIHNHFNHQRHLNRHDILNKIESQLWQSGVNSPRESRGPG
jgi:putative transposase